MRRGVRARGISYLVEREQPTVLIAHSWYTQKQQWDLSPGFEKVHARILNGRSIPIAYFVDSMPVGQLPPSTADISRSPVFPGPCRSAASSASRRQGPRQAHPLRARAFRADGRDRDDRRHARHLDPVLRGNICERCRSEVRRSASTAGRDAVESSPRPSLNGFFIDYARADEGQSSVEQVEQMKASQRTPSQGRLGCVSCHDAHEVPDPAGKGHLLPRSVWLATEITDAAPRTWYAWQETERIIALDATCQCLKAADVIAHRCERSPDPEEPA